MPSPTFLIACGVVLCALSMGLRQSFGLFLAPITAAQGFTASAFAFAIACQILLNGASQPFMGNLADRFGGRRVLWGGAALYSLGLVLMASLAGYVVFFLGAGLVLGIAVSAAGFPIVMAGLQRLLPEAMRGRAVGLVTAGSSFGQFSVVPLVATGIGAFGWQHTLYAMAAVGLLIAVLASPLTGDAPKAGVKKQPAGEALRAALSTGQFWCLFFGFFVCGVHVSFLTTHLPGFVASCGLHPWYGGAAMGFLWLSTVPPTVQLCARSFGTQWLATIFGIVFFGHQIGGFAGAWLGGLVWDATGSYDLMWWLSIGAGAFAAVVNLPVRDPTLPLVARPA